LALPVSVAPGGAASFTVGFAPASASNFSGSISLISNTPNSPLVVPLGGAGISTVLQLSASATALSFGSPATDTTATQGVTISITENSSVSISPLQAVGHNGCFRAGLLLRRNGSGFPGMESVYSSEVSAIIP
jgi:hypothetical protein